ncbi:MAG: phage integrase Arm DNA-binding domain-containing protein [Legionellales bacterium]|nr:phage integrase Arm DNA-binding domain-containing protein [Legionellales bacterium]
MARARLRKNKLLPPNLYFETTKKIYRYRRPDTGKKTSLGKDKAKAFAAAKKLNSIYMAGEDLVAKVTSNGKTLSQYINENFVPIHLPERELSENTLKGYMRQLKHIHKELGGYPVYGISIKLISEFLSKINGSRQYNKYRGLLAMIFQYAKGEGYIITNPASDTLKRNAKTQRKRLSYEGFKAIYEMAGKENMAWFQAAMELNLITLQRREEISSAKFSDISVEEIKGKKRKIMRVIQRKTEKHGASAHIKIIVNEVLEQFIEKQKNTGINSPFIIHYMPKRIPNRKGIAKDRGHHTQLLPDQLSRAFADLRDKTGLYDHLNKKQKPTFHEMRSLAIKLHEDRGFDAQALAGHTTRQMTEAYKAGHEIEWTYAEAADVDGD